LLQGEPKGEADRNRLVLNQERLEKFFKGTGSPDFCTVRFIGKINFLDFFLSSFALSRQKNKEREFNWGFSQSPKKFKLFYLVFSYFMKFIFVFSMQRKSLLKDKLNLKSAKEDSERGESMYTIFCEYFCFKGTVQLIVREVKLYTI